MPMACLRGEEVWKGETFTNFVCFAHLKLLQAADANRLYSFQVPAYLTDVEGNWQAGAIAVVIDNIAAATVKAALGGDFPISVKFPVSVDFSISYFSPAKTDEEVMISSRIVERKGNLTAVAVEMRRKEDTQLVAFGWQWMSTPSRVTSKL